MTKIIWTGKGSNDEFSTTGNWSANQVPGPNDDAVISSATTVDVVSSESVNTLTTGAGTVVRIDAGTFSIADVPSKSSTGISENAGELVVRNSATLDVAGTIDNTGRIVVSSTSNNTDFVVNGPSLVLTGAGTLELTDSFDNRIYAVAQGETLYNKNNVIEGGGQIGLNNGNYALNLINGSAGVINANADNSVLEIWDGGGLVTNLGLIEATGAAGLVVYNTEILNNGGTLAAIGASTLHLEGAYVSGGLLTTSSGGTIAVDNGQVTTLDGSGANVTNGGFIEVFNASTLDLLGTIDNLGTIALGSTYNNTDLVVAGSAVTLTDAGTIALSDNGANRIYAAAQGYTLVNENTILGAGEIGLNNGNYALNLINRGTIDANASSHSLIIEDNGGLVTNLGPIEATGSAGLVVYNTEILNNGGTLAAVGPGTLHLEGAYVSGGLLTTSSGGTILVDNGQVTTLDGSGANVVNGGSLAIANASTLELFGTIDNVGTIAPGSTYNYTDVIIGGGTVTLTGSGTLALSNNTANRIYAATQGNTLFNENTIAGGGEIGVNNGNYAINLVNSGTIDANAPDAALTIEDAGGLVTNLGLIEATGAAGLVIYNTEILNNGGTIAAIGSGHTVHLQGAYISGGLIETSGGGTVVADNGQSTLDGSGANIVNSGLITIVNGQTIDLLGTIDNVGTIAPGSTYNYTDLDIGGTVTLTGSGTIAFSDNGANRINVVSNGATLINQNNVIEGGGQIGTNNGGAVLNVVNSGVIDATGTNASLLIWTGGGSFVNSGLVEATNTAGLVISNTTITNKAGTVAAVGAGHNVYLENAGIQGGLIETSGGGEVIVTNGNATLDGSSSPVANSGQIEVVNGNTLYLYGSIDNLGTIGLGSTYNYTDLDIGGGTVTLDGAGTIELSDNGANRINVAESGDTLVNKNNVIEGSGQIGTNNGAAVLNIVNSGTIDATDSSAQLTLWTGGGSVTNTGLIEATGTAGLVVSNTTINNSGGTIAAIGTGHTVYLQSAGIQGGLIESVSGGGFQVGLATLDGSTSPVTVNADLNVVAGGTLTLDGAIHESGSILGTGTLVDNGTISFGGGVQTIASTLTGSGILLENSGGMLLISGSAHNFNGSIVVQAGTVVLANTGDINASQIDFEATTSRATFEISEPSLPSNNSTFVAPLDDFDSDQEVLHLDGFDFVEGQTSATVSNDLLTVTNGTETLSFTLSGAEASHYNVYDDGNGGLFVTSDDTAPCYCPGTLIMTDHGPVEVEQLAIGDLVLVHSGALRPIKWIGKRDYAGHFIRGRRDILPVCFTAGSLEQNVPARDLWVSPHHAIYLDGMLIEAKDLINDITIYQADVAEEVTYIHIELDSHDVILAEGAWAESFIDDDSRAMFHNAHEYAALYPGASSKLGARYYAPRVDCGQGLENLRKWLEAHAGFFDSLRPVA